MKTRILVQLFVALLLIIIPSFAAKDESVTVALTIRHNGKDQPLPGQVTLEYEGRSEQLRVQNRLLVLPPEIHAAKSVTISFRLHKELIRIPNIVLSKFTGGSWTVVLEDNSFGEEYRWAIPKGARISSSCISLFEPNNSESTFDFVQGCRIKNQ